VLANILLLSGSKLSRDTYQLSCVFLVRSSSRKIEYELGLEANRMSGTGRAAQQLAPVDNHNSAVLLIKEQSANDRSVPFDGGLAKSRRFYRYTESHAPEFPVGGTLKRSLDIIVSLAGLILLGPLLLVVALLTYLSMGRPVIFAHERVGFDGKNFKCYKFRTMVNDAGAKLAVYLSQHPFAAEEWRICHKLKNDPRVTPLGLLLRKASVDELPQLINVLRGDMSCVGPRPVPRDELLRYRRSARYYRRVRPGLTGLWQVSGRSKTTYAYRVALDRTYVRSWSFWLDIKIILKTVPAVFRFHEVG
jgi:exopolysaccharide production protein ExoY